VQVRELDEALLVRVSVAEGVLELRVLENSAPARQRSAIVSPAATRTRPRAEGANRRTRGGSNGRRRRAGDPCHQKRCGGGLALTMPLMTGGLIHEYGLAA